MVDKLATADQQPHIHIAALATSRLGVYSMRHRFHACHSSREPAESDAAFGLGTAAMALGLAAPSTAV
jgi:hypothetical protein